MTDDPKTKPKMGRPYLFGEEKMPKLRASVPQSDIDALHAVADERGVSLSAVVREAVHEWLVRHHRR
jgi:hypothetical protein